MALVMVWAGERGAPSLRLVQDFRGPDDPDAAMLDPGIPAATAVAEPYALASGALSPAAAMTGAPAVPKRGRGRPPGSRIRKPRENSANDGNSSTSLAPPPANSGISGNA